MQLLTSLWQEDILFIQFGMFFPFHNSIIWVNMSIIYGRCVINRHHKAEIKPTGLNIWKNTS